MKMRVLCLALAAGLFICSSAPAAIVVSWDPPATIDPVGGSANLSIWADIPEADAVVGWGLDLYFNEALVTVTGIVYGPAWSSVYAATPDPTDPLNVDFNFAAITTFPPPLGVWGSSVLLATLTFQGIGLGTTSLHLGDHNPPDLNEGFAKNPPPTGAFVPWTTIDGQITVIPEPATLVLLGLGLVGLLRRR